MHPNSRSSQVQKFTSQTFGLVSVRAEASFLPEQQFFEKQKVSLAVQYNTHSQDYESNAECGTGHQRPSDAILKDMKNENPR